MLYSRLVRLVSALIFSVAHAIAVPIFIDAVSSTSPLRISSITTSPIAATQPLNITYSPLTFLGVDCYHLQPNTVSLQLCQPLFAKLFRDGNVYKKHNWWNGIQLRTGRRGPCTITLSSPARDDRFHMVKLSIAEIVTYATEVLETCQETSTGGANTFEGTWKVAVTKYPPERATYNSSLSKE